MIKVPDSPSKIHPSLSSFKTWRPHQKEAVEAIANSDKQFFILNAPTGVGKSIIAIASALLSSEKTYITTHTKQLQDQYLKDFPEIVKTIKGRSNYQCLFFQELTAENCIEQTKQRCPMRDQCPYKKAKQEVITSKVAIFNNAYYLTALNYTDQFPTADLVIIDETHLIEHSLMNFIECKLTKSQMDSLLLPYPTPKEDIIEYLKTLLDKIITHHSTLQEELKYAVKSEDQNNIQDLSKLIKKYQSIERNVKFLLSNMDNTWIIDYTPLQITFKPIFVHPYNEHIFAHGEKFLLMSATLSKSIIDTLNLPKNECEYMEIPSPFPVENRPLVFTPRINMSYKTQQKALPILTKLINKVLDKHESEKGIIHTSSNKLANYIHEHCSHKDRTLIATGQLKQQALEIHKKSKNTVLISPSLDTGVDFKYDDGRFQIIVNLPFPSLADKQVKKRARIDKNWYIGQMTNKLVQMYGRTNRAEDDYSTTYVFDERLYYYLKKYPNHFPKWFIEAVVKRDYTT